MDRRIAWEIEREIVGEVANSGDEYKNAFCCLCRQRPVSFSHRDREREGFLFCFPPAGGSEEAGREGGKQVSELGGFIRKFIEALPPATRRLLLSSATAVDRAKVNLKRKEPLSLSCLYIYVVRVQVK